MTWHVAPTSPPVVWDVDIAASDYYPTLGELVAITATANYDVSGTGMAIEIYNPITGEIHHSCDTGYTCSTSARPDFARPFYYVARVSFPGGSGVRATSNEITVTWTEPAL